MPEITDNQVVTVRYRDPIYDEDYVFSAKKLKNAIDPPTVLAPDRGGGDGGGGAGGGYGGGGGNHYKPQIGKFIIDLDV